MQVRTQKRVALMIEKSRSIGASLCEADLALANTMLDQLRNSRDASSRDRIFAHAKRSLAAVKSILRRLKLKRAPEQRIRALAQEVVARLERESRG